MKPNFLVIGAQKCATSSLCDLIARHPRAFMTTPKEPYFFSHDEIYARGWDWYESLFDGAEGRQAIGEGSTTYTQPSLWPHAAQRIAEHLPEARLIYIVRDPLDRIESQWMHLRTKGNQEDLPFNEAVRARTQYIDNSRYGRQISLYRKYYDDSRILILFFEDFKRTPDLVMRRVFEFLDIDPDVELEDVNEARHVSAEGRVDRSALGALRRVPAFTMIRDSAPTWLREPLRLVFKRPIEGRPQWAPETRQWAIEQLADESIAFLERYGKPPDFWPELVRQAS